MKLKITLQGGATIEIDGVEKFETEQSAPSFPLQPNNPFPPILPYPPIVYPGTGGTGDYQRPFDVTWCVNGSIQANGYTSYSMTVNGVTT